MNKPRTITYHLDSHHQKSVTFVDTTSDYVTTEFMETTNLFFHCDSMKLVSMPISMICIRVYEDDKHKNILSIVRLDLNMENMWIKWTIDNKKVKYFCYCDGDFINQQKKIFFTDIEPEQKVQHG